MFGIGAGEIVVILLVPLILFGGKKLPELMRGLGKGYKAFQDSMKGIEDEIQKTTSEIEKDINDKNKEGKA